MKQVTRSTRHEYSLDVPPHPANELSSIDCMPDVVFASPEVALKVGQDLAMPLHCVELYGRGRDIGVV